MPGLEARVGLISNALYELPGSGKNQISPDEFLVHSTNGARGMISDAHALRRAAKQREIDPRVVGELTSILKETRHSWTVPQQRALFLAPLNDWLAHPMVRHNLGLMPKAQELGAVERYRSRVNNLIQARFNANVHYRPDWATGAPQHITNVVYRAPGRPSFAAGETVAEWKPDDWFYGILAAESARFVRGDAITINR